MKENVKIEEFLNDKLEERYLIKNTNGDVLHKAGGAGFKTVRTAEIFAESHFWNVISKPIYSDTPSLF